MLGVILSIVKIPLMLAGKIIKFFGLYWIILWMISVFIIEGKFGTGASVVFIENCILIAAMVLAVLTAIQNIVRMFKRDNFSIYEFISGLFRKKKAVGTVATTDMVSKNDLQGMVFGKLKGKYAIKDEKEMGIALVLGGSRSGKTSGVCIPTLKSWNGGVFAIDIKGGELYRNTKTAREQKKRSVKWFNPCDHTANKYDPFHVLKTTRNAPQTVREIAMAILPCPADAKDPFWYKQGQDFLSGAILHYVSFGLNFPEVMMQIKTRTAAETVAYIMEGENEKAKLFINQFVGMSEETLVGIYAEVSQSVMVFVTDDDLIRALDGKGDCISPEDIENGADIFVCVEEDLLDQWRPLMTMIVNQFIKHFERRELGNTDPILFMLDEFPKLGKIESMTSAVSTLAGRGIHPMIMIQSLAHLQDSYGDKKAKIILDNCNYKALLKAGDSESQKWCADLVGKYDADKTSVGYNADIAGIGKGINKGKTTEQRYIIEPDQFGYMAEQGYLILIAPSGYKKLDKIKWWIDDAFKN